MKYLKVNRDAGGRGRYIYSRDENEKSYLTGVTTILGESAKPYLVPWANKEAYTEALMLAKTPEGLTEIRRILKDKDYKSSRIVLESTSKGTMAHNLVDEFIKHYIATGEYKKKEIVTTSENQGVAISVNRFYNWAITNDVKFLSADDSVYSTKYFYAGSFDFICEIDGKIYLGDFKTSKEIDVTYPAQCAAYIKAYQEIAEIEDLPKRNFAGSIVIKSTLAEEDAVRFEKSSTGKMKQKITPAFEIKISTSIDLDFQFFFSCLFQYKYKKGKEIMEWNKLELLDSALNLEYNDEDYPLSLVK